MDHPLGPLTPSAKLPPPKPRTVPLRILALGLNRTGTQSLTQALGVLGIPSSQIYTLGSITEHKQEPIWDMHLDAKYKGLLPGKPLGAVEFDDLMGEYSVIMDLIPTLFTPELLAAYPDAKVILTTRASEEAWFESCKATVIHVYTPEPSVHLNKRLADKCIRILYGEDFEKDGKRIYAEHNEKVRELAKGRLLEYQPGGGWGPLCEFLGVEVPEAEYPRIDSWVEYKERFRNGEVKK